MISNFADPLKENGSLKSRLEEFPVITVVIIIVILQHFSYFSNLFLFLCCKILTWWPLDFGSSLNADWVVSVEQNMETNTVLYGPKYQNVN